MSKFRDDIIRLFHGKELVMNLGCGEDYIPGMLNVDKNTDVKSDYVWELGKSPFPKGKDKFDGVLCSHLLEHIPDLREAKKELLRILKPGGLMVVIVPNYLSLDAWGDDTHCRAFSLHSFIPSFWPGYDRTKTECLFVPAKDSLGNELLWIVCKLTKE